MHLASTNLPAPVAELLCAELAALPARAAVCHLHVVDLSTGPELPPAVAAALALKPCPAANPPVEIAARWEWEAHRQSYQFVPQGDRLYVVGAGQEGAMYGFYRALRDLRGCRWYSLDPEEDLVGLPPRPLPVGVVKPDVALRGYEGALAKWDTPFLARLFRWMLRNGWNLVLFNAAQWAARDDRKTIAEMAHTHGIRLIVGGHAADYFLPESLFAEHPEYFGMRDGQRCLRAATRYPEMPGKTPSHPVQPCYGSAATRRFLAERIASFIDANPAMSAFSLWPHDGSNNWCQCPDCLASTPYAMMHDLAREILARLRRPIPIEVLAYCNLLDPPRAPLTPEPRLYTLFCPYLRQYRHRFDDPGFPPERLTIGCTWPEPEPVNPLDDREYGVLLDRWLPHWDAARSGLGIFAYYQLAFVDETGRSDRCRYLDHPDPHLVADELRTFHRHGMRLFYDCSWPLPGYWPDARYQAYLGHQLWDLSADPQATIDAFYRETLGSHAPAVQAAMRAVAAALDRPERPPVPDKVLSAAQDALAPLPGPRGDRYRVWLDYVRLADRSWQERRQGGDYAATEAAIQTLLQEHESLLAPNLQVTWMLRHSRGMAR